MATILNAEARRAVRSTYNLNQFVLDHGVKAFDSLVIGDGDQYKKSIADANEAMGYGRPLTEKDRPTAVDQVIGICCHVFAKKHNIDIRTVLPELKRRSGILS